MPDEFSRTRLIIGDDGLQKLKSAKVIVFGVGGVGSFVVEALARGGIGRLDIVDNDAVAITNINRQLIALHSTIGLQKVDVLRERLVDINQEITVNAFDLFVSGDTIDTFDFAQYTYVVDAVDTVSAKLLIIERCKAAGTPVISSMGTGNKLDPTRFCVSDIADTRVCPLARIMRRELRARGIADVKVVYSDEEIIRPKAALDEVTTRRSVPGSISFVPPSVGLLIACEVIKDILSGGPI